MSWKIVVGIGLIIAAIGYLLPGWLVTPEMWVHEYGLAMDINIKSFGIVCLGVIVVIAGIALRSRAQNKRSYQKDREYLAAYELKTRVEQKRKADTIGVCDECGKQILGSYVACDRCDHISCSQKCAREHYYHAHEP